MSYDTDVLVVGAGPTGMTAAIELARRNVGVRITETEESVRGTVEQEEGGTFEVEARYLVGADGAHSTVPKTLELPFECSSYDL